MQMSWSWAFLFVCEYYLVSGQPYDRYTLRNPSQSQFDYSYQPQLDSNRIIDGFVQPIMNMIDPPSKKSPAVMNSVDNTIENYLKYPWVFTSKPPTTTPPPSLMDTLFKPFEPFMLPFKEQLDKVTKDQSLITNFLDGKPLAPLNSNTPRKSPLKHVSTQNDDPTAGQRPVEPSSYPNPLSTLLEPLGMNAKPREEIQIGRDKSLSILGMPVGRRDGLQLSPLQGLSLGGQNMYGPIAVNDKYSVNWNFLDGIGKLFGGDL